MTSAIENDLWFRRFPSAAQGASHRLICFPHAGGAASSYAQLARALSPAVEVVAVQYPGRQDRRGEPRLENVQVLARAVVTALGDPPSVPPYALFGHSMGAIVAYEVARLLAARPGNGAGARGPARLFASGSDAPQARRDGTVHRRDDAGVVAELRRLSGTDSFLLGDPELLAMALPAIRSDYTAIETYRWAPGPPLSCPITVLTGDTDPQTTPSGTRAWETCTSAGCDAQAFEGDHFFLDPHVTGVARLIRASLGVAGGPA
ncbi:thioesterase II family protein [Streptomyces sp. NBC_01803]|uniref:thioesterase II family protein n=1 Tax=Streptomyces sp. NBC_01803 TaxID=2975946 RepID=UPI002DDA1F50|nr:alpha/beta fold hydrolase [Streptomyces sp. NBC_01803]WSA42978.1 alpha/beta fold hydrolase [Streptomyces sp. NBC_01803]